MPEFMLMRVLGWETASGWGLVTRKTKHIIRGLELSADPHPCRPTYREERGAGY